jgi:hypothetical protein
MRALAAGGGSGGVVAGRRLGATLHAYGASEARAGRAAWRSAALPRVRRPMALGSIRSRVSACTPLARLLVPGVAIWHTRRRGGAAGAPVAARVRGAARAICGERTCARARRS